MNKSDEQEIYDTVCELYIQKFKHYMDETSGYVEFSQKNPKEGIFISQCLMCRKVVSCNIDMTDVLSDDGKPTVDVIVDEDEPICSIKPPPEPQ